ncbi:MAG TPA: hypothetical protein VFW92_08545 [Candidatus Limnocylindrales bacterium]|nr:hypothetical protein [Candidatus Limnocylindrales bacterium]
MTARGLKAGIASSAYIIALAPEEPDEKMALEIGYAVLLDKPIIQLVAPGRKPLPGLERLAVQTIVLRAPMDTPAGANQLHAELVNLDARFRHGQKPS